MKKLYLCAFVSAFFWQCGQAPLASGGSGGIETTNGMTASVILEDNLTAKVGVRLRPLEYLVGDSLTSWFTIDTVTDTGGVFVLDSIPSGQYLLECLYQDSLGLVRGIVFEDGDSFKDLGTLELEKSVKLDGYIESRRDSSRPMLRVFGLERRIFADEKGSYEMSIPARYRFTLRASDEDTLVDTTLTQEPSPNETRMLNIDLGSYEYDSILVNKFLSSAQVTGFDWQTRAPRTNNRLRTLILDSLGIDSLPASIGGLHFLRTLSLSGNPLKNLPEGLGRLDGLNALIMEDADFGYIPRPILKLNELLFLNMNACSLVAIPDSIGLLKSLKSLWLKGNRIDSLPAALYTLSNLQDLKVSHNAIRSLSPDIDKLQSLTSFTADNNRLSALPDQIATLQNLKAIRAYNNELTAIPDSIGTLPSLHILQISNNQITQLPSSIGRITGLEKLEIANNPLSSLPESVTNLTNLTRLGVYGCRLCTVSPAIDTWLVSYLGENWKTDQRQTGCE